MGILIDSSILIASERGKIDLAHQVAQRPDEECFLSVVTASELLHGVHRAVRADIQAQRSAFVEGVLRQFPLLPIDLATARAHAQLWAELAMSGKLIGPHDLWLSATCLARGLAIATANVREFQRVPGLKVETWNSPSPNVP
jgi:tRNA(fMet)-specific endonuclease VapC